MIFCEWCDDGNVQFEGWHTFVDDEPGFERTYRLACAIHPPDVETVAEL